MIGSPKTHSAILYCNLSSACLSNQLMNDTKEQYLSGKHLIDSILRGDTQNFGIIIKNTERLVAQITFKMITNAEDRKDMAQDIYLKVFKNLSGFNYQAKLSTWIAQIAYNTCLNYLEKKKLVLGYTFEEEDKDDELGILNHHFTENEEAEKFLFQKELSQILGLEIEKLSPIYQTLISLFHIQELSYSEIAEITNLPEGTVKNYLFRARKVLKDRLLRNYNRGDL